MKKVDKNCRVAVIGCGIIGLSTALCLRKSPSSVHEIIVFGKELPPNITGDKAAGVWKPAYSSDTKPDKLWKWSKKTWDYLDSFFRTSTHFEKGIFQFVVHILSDDPHPSEKPFWADIVYAYYQLSRDEVKKLCPSAETGHQMTTICAEGGRMIDHVLKEFVAIGGRCMKREIFSFDELINEGFDLIINCSGLGAKRLCGDNEVFPIRGQIRIIEAPWIRSGIIFGDDYYIIPNQDKVIIGGTHQKGDWDLNVREEDMERIVAGCSKIVPSIKNAPVIRDWVGLRPGRTEIRLEREDRISASGKPYSIIHNYGHGGSGLTLFWGCAEDALDLALDALKMSQLAKL